MSPSTTGSEASSDSPGAGDPLRFAEEVILLLLRDAEGTIVPVPRRALHLAIAGSVLMDLAMENRVDTDLNHLILIDSSPVGDDVLDPTLADIAASEQKDTRFWVDHIAGRAEEIHADARARLVARGILAPDKSRHLGLFRSTRYADVEDETRIQTRRHIRTVLLSDDIPHPREVMLICLANACGILSELLSAREMGIAARRIAQIRRMDLIGQAMTRAVDSVETAITASIADDRE